MLEEVRNPIIRVGSAVQEPTLPRILVEISGPKSAAKQELTNRALVDWQVNLRMKKVKAGEYSYYAPVIQNMELRTFFAKMKDFYSFQYNLSNLKNLMVLLVL